MVGQEAIWSQVIFWSVAIQMTSGQQSGKLNLNNEQCLRQLSNTIDYYQVQRIDKSEETANFCQLN